jgi:hypothetical protein
MANLGQQFVRQAFIAKKQSDSLYEKITKDVKKLNKRFHKYAVDSYDILVDRLTMDISSIVNSMDNLEKLSLWMPSFDMLLNRYRVEYKNAYENNRVLLFHLLKDKELRLMKVVSKMGVKDDRVTIQDSTLEMMSAINTNMYRNIENMLVKWRNYVYDTFFQGITQSLQKDALRDKFITPTGTLKIGSSLEETSELEASMAAVAEKMAYLRDNARRNGYTYCWNVNPMDRRTKPICMEASLAGVIRESEMLSAYGFPPRHICRCEIAYTREEWTELNQSINVELRSVRERLIDELIDAPRQLSQFYIAGKLVIPSDPVRAAGDKMYAEIEEKLELARRTEVPDFEVE